MDVIDLHKKKYDCKILKNNIYMLNLVDILNTQHIDASFAVKYILNPKYQFAKNELLITPKLVLKLQPHIQPRELQLEMLRYDSDNDSIDDFETISNKK